MLDEGYLAVVTTLHRDPFFEAYVECALWSSCDDGGESLDSWYGVDDIAPETLAEMHEQCEDFKEDNAQTLEDAYSRPGYDEARAGHDFWLTRNGHGAGFWDRGLGDIGERLTKAAKVYGGVDLMVGDDGLIY